MNAGKIPRATSTHAAEASTSLEDEDSNIPDEERALASPRAPFSFLQRRINSSRRRRDRASYSPQLHQLIHGRIPQSKTSTLLGAVTSSGGHEETPLAPRLAVLVEAYATSPIATEIENEKEEVPSGGDGSGEMWDMAVESLLLKGTKRASWCTQFKILSGRAF